MDPPRSTSAMRVNSRTRRPSCGRRVAGTLRADRRPS
jgi:hypothetical protein